ncbi:MAG: molybdopterin-guanine dinucleotide biosynthesis protein B [Thiobacillus sp.]|nr:molybdopterin-guanine dinucleotide biosynthesis protein B [Thiobacillus sp.]
MEKYNSIQSDWQRKMKIFGIAGYSGSGKTTLIERVLPQLIARGLKVAVIKHTHHDFDIDPPPGGGRGCKGAEAPTTTHRPGKDSWRARAAGAAAVLLASDHRTAVLMEHRDTPPALDDLLDQLPPCDLVLVEGYKRCAIPKLEVHRAETGKSWLFPDDPTILVVASDVDAPDTFPRIDLDAISQLTDFIIDHAYSRPTA